MPLVDSIVNSHLCTVGLERNFKYVINSDYFDYLKVFNTKNFDKFKNIVFEGNDVKKFPMFYIFGSKFCKSEFLSDILLKFLIVKRV